ncbi:MAG: hypothetical protein ACRCZD_06770 [Phycicoccus sp.]
MGHIDQERYDAAADWAEREAIIDFSDPDALRGQDAQAFTRDLLRRAGSCWTPRRPRTTPTAPTS